MNITSEQDSVEGRQTLYQVALANGKPNVSRRIHVSMLASKDHSESKLPPIKSKAMPKQALISSETKNKSCMHNETLRSLQDLPKNKYQMGFANSTLPTFKPSPLLSEIDWKSCDGIRVSQTNKRITEIKRKILKGAASIELSTSQESF